MSEKVDGRGASDLCDQLGLLPDYIRDELPDDLAAQRVEAWAACLVAAERERCITTAEDAYIAGKGAKGCIDAIRARCGPNVPTKPAREGSA